MAKSNGSDNSFGDSTNAEVALMSRKFKQMMKKKGKRTNKTLQMKRQQSADGKLDVLIHPTKLVAVGPGYNDFITGLSLIVHQNARLNVLQWKKVPQSTRDTIVQNILVCLVLIVICK